MRVLLYTLLLCGFCSVAQVGKAQDNTELLKAIQAQLEKVSTQVEDKKKQERDLNNPAYIKGKIVEHDEYIESLENPTAGKKPKVQKNIDTSFIMICAVLVFFMQVGFCMLEMGLVRSKNCINVAMKNVLDFSAVSITYLLFGFTFMYGSGAFIGSDTFTLWKEPGDSPIWAFWFFQVVFAATCCTIASGAMAERTKFLGYLIYTVFLSGLLYPVFGKWVWGSYGGAYGFGGDKGWLEALGFVDFAGATVVHGVGGATALAGIIVLGARVGRFSEDGEARYIPGHSLPLVAFGTLILWAGWFGFNAGSSLEGSVTIGRICVNTAVGGAAACIAGMGLFWALRGIPNVLVAMNGVLGGLVSVTACCHVINPLSALIIGAVAGVIATAGAILLERMRLDDVAGAVPVHLFNGIWGTIAVAIFNEKGFELNSLGIQAFGSILICLFAFGIAFVMFKLIDTFVGLRADDLDQEDGLDFVEHSANAYPDFETTEH